MIKKPITIHLSTGLEARPVAQLVQVASQFNSEDLCRNWQEKGECKEYYGYDDAGTGCR